MADIDLPVFSFRPDWKAGVTERVSFLTNVLRSKSGAEQRTQNRATPRRTIEADFLLVDNERTFFDVFMSRLGGQEVMAPLYWDIVTLQSAAVADTTARIVCDTSWREFRAGGLAILQRKDAQEYEVVEIESIDSTGMNLADPVTRNWPVGTLLMPLRRMLIDDMGAPSQPSAAVATVTVRLLSNSPNPWTPQTDPATVYAGLPVFAEEPNWVDGMDVSFDRDTTRFDNLTGRLYQVDPLTRFFVGQGHRWFLHGRQKLGEFRDLIYRRAGRLGAFWLPTFKADLRLASPAVSAATQITVEKAGLDYADVPHDGREYLAIRHDGGTIYRRITSVLPGLTTTTERVNLDLPVGLDLAPGQVRKISFMDAARFDQDDFEITHHAGIDGLHECSASFRTFSNARTAPSPISYPIAAAIKTNEPCGEAEDNCYKVPWNGWTYHLVHTWKYRPGTPFGPEDANIYGGAIGPRVLPGMMPNGKTTNPEEIFGWAWGADMVVEEGTLRGYRDNNYSDGSLGGPMFGIQWIDYQPGPFGGPIGWEMYFYYPFTEPRHISWAMQFGTSSFYIPSLAGEGPISPSSFALYDRQGNILASGSDTVQALWPRGYSLSW